ncbi:hypothetical protein SKAU_G00211230 [Synaphobranchus kaupii]|uniref:Uncharacterized protein n=1 Tax=Synaphobranchus kaupii TaxID=118154 RepID=A0A9Q1F9G4_SYNKA|nr:hypothetical protein SKAU_G00211230 [Synaphobranchus kaupii]
MLQGERGAFLGKAVAARDSQVKPGRKAIVNHRAVPVPLATSVCRATSLSPEGLLLLSITWTDQRQSYTYTATRGGGSTQRRYTGSTQNPN